MSRNRKFVLVALMGALVGGIAAAMDSLGSEPPHTWFWRGLALTVLLSLAIMFWPRSTENEAE